MVACGGGGGGNPAPTPFETANTNTTSTTSPAPTITSEEEYCTGYTLYRDTTYSDGTVQKQLLEENSEECGYSSVPAVGTVLSDPYCIHEEPDDLEAWKPYSWKQSHWDQVQRVADGEGGYTLERVVHIAEACFIEMEEPDECLTTYSFTGDSRYEYLTCDGVKQRTPVSFPYNPDEDTWNAPSDLAIIDILIVFDTKMTLLDRDGKTVEEFVRHQLHYANNLFYISSIPIALRLVGIKLVEVAPGDLYRQYYTFPTAKQEFKNLNTWQTDANADIAFLFKKIEEDPIACGVANTDGTRGITYTRGVVQCFTNTVFQETSTTRYYERAQETFTHEVGHILGLEHNWSIDDETGENSAGIGLFEYSYGYLLQPGYNPQKDNPEYGGAWGGYGTIMSYADLPTGRFSDRSVTCTYPEGSGEYTGTSVRMGTEGGCFCSAPIESQPPPTDARDHLNRVRYLMSQLSENNHSITDSRSYYMQTDPTWNYTPHSNSEFELEKWKWEREMKIMNVDKMLREFERKQDLCLF